MQQPRVRRLFSGIALAVLLLLPGAQSAGTPVPPTPTPTLVPPTPTPGPPTPTNTPTPPTPTFTPVPPTPTSTPVGDIDVSPATLNFGDVDVGGTSLMIVTVTNTASGLLEVSSIELKVGSDPEFSILDVSPEVPTSLSLAGVVDVMIELAPTAEVDLVATLEVMSDDPDESTVEVDLSGHGVPFDEQAMELLDLFDSLGLVGAGQGKSGPRRLAALRNMIEAAGDLIDGGLFDDACDQLLDALHRTDGEFPPPDFVEEGQAASELAAGIEDLLDNLGCPVEPEPAGVDSAESVWWGCGIGYELVILLPLAFALRRGMRGRRG